MLKGMRVMKSIKYLLFGIGMMLLAILCNNFYKGEGVGASFFVILMYAIIPYVSMIVGLFYLIKGLVTKE